MREVARLSHRPHERGQTGWLRAEETPASSLPPSSHRKLVCGAGRRLTKRPGAGRIKLYWGHDLLGTFSPAAETAQRQVRIKLSPFSSVETNRLRIETSSSDAPVRIDGVGVSKV